MLTGIVMILYIWLVIHPTVLPSICLSVGPSDCPKWQCWHFNYFRIEIWCEGAWSRLLSNMAVLSQLMHIPHNFEILHDKLEQGLRDNVTALTIKKLVWNWRGWCTVRWSRLLYKMAILGKILQILHVSFFHFTNVGQPRVFHSLNEM